MSTPLITIPVIVKHMTIAIYGKAKLSSNTDEQFKQAFAIARAKLVEWGYLSGGSAQGDASNIRLTGKGTQRNIKHIRERGDRSDLFDQLYTKLEAAEGSNLDTYLPEDSPTHTADDAPEKHATIRKAKHPPLTSRKPKPTNKPPARSKAKKRVIKVRPTKAKSVKRAKRA